LGPSRDGNTADAVRVPFAAQGPSRLWNLKIGQGFAGPVIAEGKVVLFHRVGDEEVVEALDRKTGKPCWRHAYPTAFSDDFGFDEGPRGTPCVRGGRVVTFGAEGRLTCLSLVDGTQIWQVDTKAQFHADKGFFGPACSPLIDGALVLLNLGGKDGAGVAAFDLDTGKLAWKVTDHEAGYASPVTLDRAAGRLALFFTRSGLVGVETTTGKLRFEFPWRARMHASVNAASPVVDGDHVLLTASYGAGAVLLRLKPGGDGVDKVWSSDDSLSAHYATPVKHGAFLYGFHGRQESGTRLRCIEWSSGKVRWDTEMKAGTVAVAGDKLVVLTENGELTIASATPDAFHPLARAQILGSGTRAPFALSEGLLVARDKSQIGAFDLRP
jgi:outer membrane protein assembly factor BamB